MRTPTSDEEEKLIARITP